MSSNRYSRARSVLSSKGGRGVAVNVAVDEEGGPVDPQELQSNARRASQLLKALGNEHRLMILCLLLNGERAVGELVREVGLSQSALSQHLARLRRDGLVSTRRSAQTIYYALAGSEAHAVIGTLYRLYCHREAGETRPVVSSAPEPPRLSPF
jgi:ArsR family transcriptional regulator, virulence genes transcriptional regulator